MPKITPHLWFDTQARTAAEFYTRVFPHSQIDYIVTLPDTPSGECDVVTFKIWHHEFQAISAGPLFKANPSISFMVNFDPSREVNAAQMLDAAWQQLAEGGQVLMPLDKYPFSARYGWIQDKYGISWQLILTDPTGEPRPPIMPALLFVGDVCGQAETATNFYLSVFTPSRRGTLARYPTGMEPDKAGTVMFTDFQLADTWMVAMDSAQNHNFAFNEAISLVINCETSAEIDYYWQKMSAVPEAEQCGWIKDKFGISWQVVPTQWHQLMKNASPAQVAAMTRAFLPMKKLDLEVIKAAYESASPN